jgi:carboxylate-amine ligase
VEAELHACQVELITEPCDSAAAAVAQLRALRRAVAGTGVGLLGSGTHPSATEGEAEITDKARYERIHHLLGDAVATPVAGLHVHVGMPDAETAIRVFNALRRHLPLLQALAANSPFRHGRNTGLASVREVTLRSWPRSGVPRAIRDYEDFCATAARLARAADVPDYTWFWWKLRPHPRLGTVEIRALDVQSTHEDTETLVALIHCLCRAAVDLDGEPSPAPELVEEGLFRAARFGVLADLPDAEGRLRPTHERLLDALRTVRPHARELRAEESLERLPELIRGVGGAGRQRELFGLGGMDSLLRELTTISSA